MMNAKPEEIFVSKLLEDTIFKGYEFIVGDDIDKGLPDIYSKSFEIGIEVTKAELTADHKYDSESCKIDKNELKDGRFRDINYHLEYFKRGIEKKLKLLNQNHYSGCRKVHIVFFTIKRAKLDYQILKVKELYDELIKTQNISFESIIVITSSKIYAFDHQKEIIPYNYNDYSKYLKCLS